MLNERPSPRTPGDLLLHPVALIALVIVILNDRVLKVQYPSVLTGKLSDFAGLIYFPLFVVAFTEATRWVARFRPWELGPRSVEIVSALVGAAFVLIKTWGPAADVYRASLGIVLWPAYVLGEVIQGGGLPEVRRFDVVEDRSDLIALVALLVPLWVGRRVMVQPLELAGAELGTAGDEESARD